MVALCQAPFLLDDPNVGMLFPADAIARAKHYLSLTSGGLGIIYVHQTHYLASCQKVIYFSLCVCVVHQVLTVTQEAFLESGKRLPSLFNVVMAIQGDCLHFGFHEICLL